MEQVQRIFQAPVPLADRVERDPNIPPERKERLLMMLRSGDEELIASAAEMMEIFGYGEDYETTDIPLDNFSLDDHELEVGYRDSERVYDQSKADQQLGRYTKTTPSQKFALDKLSKSVFEEFKKKLPEMMGTGWERNSAEENEKVWMFIEELVDDFYHETVDALGQKNFFGFYAYMDLLRKNMYAHYENVLTDGNQPIDDRFV
ncbi:MAG TPA: hypothetical protein DD671_06675 [Balneolaceae bacterium]|nr:hypothetical protein [Balneolaceae bacterium]